MNWYKYTALIISYIGVSTFLFANAKTELLAWILFGVVAVVLNILYNESISFELAKNSKKQKCVDEFMKFKVYDYRHEKEFLISHIYFNEDGQPTEIHYVDDGETEFTAHMPMFGYADNDECELIYIEDIG